MLSSTCAHFGSTKCTQKVDIKKTEDNIKLGGEKDGGIEEEVEDC